MYCDKRKRWKEQRQGRMKRDDAKQLGITALGNICIRNYCHYAKQKIVNTLNKQRDVAKRIIRRIGKVKQFNFDFNLFSICRMPSCYKYPPCLQYIEISVGSFNFVYIDIYISMVINIVCCITYNIMFCMLNVLISENLLEN